jgi:SNF2 family DNA or RNA helicase
LNGGDEWPTDRDDDGTPLEVQTLLERRRKMLLESGWYEDDSNHFTHETTGATLGLTQASLGIGEERCGIRCVWTPTLARLIVIHDSFDFVVVDEGVRLQSNDAHVATGVRTLNPRYRLVLTATPIKNRLDSLFWLAHWCAGGTAEANPRWPYAGTTKERDRFASQHLLTDKYLTREKVAYTLTGEKGSHTRRTARITNLHRLWKIIAPIVLRRRKADCGEDIVPKTTHVIRVPPGEDQWRVYRHYLHHPPVRANALAAAGVQLALLRQATTSPYTALMKEEGEWSEQVHNPKLAAILTLVELCLSRGEQIVIGSNFREFGEALHRLLQEARVWSIHLDGQITPVRRGKLARDFKDQRYTVMIAGVHAMGEGHSFDDCPNLILPSLDWAYDINTQFVDRVWRMNSKQPISVYTLVTTGSIDEYLLELFHEKEDSAQLALDGALTAMDKDEASICQLLEKAIKGFDRSAHTLSEAVFAAEWPATRGRLTAAQQHYEKSIPRL